ncbi:TPA: DNA cytosine methyltransferase [Acinetobacter baumannii]|nr:DNA cytosine methyltransferase [Acinetobacter baumannii]
MNMCLNLNLLPHELIVDNFAGGGGTSTGLEKAFGRPVDIAINHDPKAIAMHRANHPNTRHFCEDVWDVDPVKVTNNQPVGLVWLSPDCKHFSKAKGGKPVEKKIRGLAWIALRWADFTRPRIIMLENVEEFKTWGRLGKDGFPSKKHKGETFRCFVNALRHQGYKVEWRVMSARDYGSPTLRRRFFLVARRDNFPIVWPKPTHAAPDSKAVKTGKLKPWRITAECIDWSIPCPSIFTRKKPLVEATCRRIANGLVRYVINNPEPFIVPMDKVKSVAPVLTECANASSPRCMPVDEPLRTICAGVKGGHHALVTAFIAKHYTGVVGSDIREPLHTITAKDHNSLVVSNLVKLRKNNIGQPVDEPLHTITTSAGHFALVQAFLTAFYGSEKDGNSIHEPLRTIPTRDRFGLVMVKGELHQIVDIGFRMLQPRELFTAQGFEPTYIIDHGIDEHGNTIKLTKTEQGRMVGNSVPPQFSEALVRANFAHEHLYEAA